MAREDPHFRLRFPEDLRARVVKSAAENHRSITAEIIARLESSFDAQSEPLPTNAFETYASEVAKAAAAEAAEHVVESFRVFLGRQTIERTEAWRSGYDRFDVKGWAGEVDNPFPVGNPKRSEWAEGFIAAAKFLEANAGYYEPWPEGKRGPVRAPHRDDPEGAN